MTKLMMTAALMALTMAATPTKAVTVQLETTALAGHVQLAALPAQALTATATVKAQRFYFEPTQADYNCCWRDIARQQEAYQEAKEVGDWDEARRLALFYFQRAWLWNNQAHAYIQATYDEGAANMGFNLEGNLQRCREWLLNAIREAQAVDPAGRHGGQAADCQKKARSNLDFVEARLEALLQQ